MKWLKLYNEARTDKKLARLTLAERGVWMNLLLYANEQEERGTFDASDILDLALECADGDEEIMQSTLDKLLYIKHLVAADKPCYYRFRTFSERQGYADTRLSPDEWQRLRAVVFERDKYVCQYCGAVNVALQCDHVIPVSRGGSNELTNLVTACAACNQSKHDKTPEEWRS